MKKINTQQKIFTAITFQGISVKVLQIAANSQKEAEKKLITAHSRLLGEDRALKVDDIMEHKSDWSFAVFDPNKIKII